MGAMSLTGWTTNSRSPDILEVVLKAKIRNETVLPTWLVE